MNHTLSDSQLEEMIKSAVNSSGPLPPDEKFSQLVSALRELQERRKAEKDSEPVAWTWHYREQWYVTNDERRAEFVAKDGDVAVLPLYRHAQPSPEMKPVGYLFVSEQGAIAYSPTNWGMPGFRLIGQIYGDIDVESQPAPVVPEEITPEMMRSVQLNSELGAYAASNLSGAYDLFAEFWKEACRAAMLQAEPVCTCPSGDGSLRWPCSVHPGNSPVIGIDVASGPDRTVEVRYVAPPGYVMVPKEPTEVMLTASYMFAHVEATRESWAAMLAAAPQPQNAPQSIPEIIPDCWCRTCRPVVLNDMRFVVCPDCGNKRCPRANDHRNACTGSNEPGQEGSAYPDAQQEVKGE